MNAIAQASTSLPNSPALEYGNACVKAGYKAFSASASTGHPVARFPFTR